MKNNEIFDIAMIGHFSKDVIIALGETTTMPGGAVYYGSIPVARMGLRAAVITKIAEGDLHLAKPMLDAGVSLFPVLSEVTSGIENRYLDATMERRECTPLAFAGAYGESDFEGIDAKIWHVGALIKGEVDLDLLRYLSARGRLSADAQGFVRVIRGNSLVYEDWADKREALPLIEFFKTDAAEAEVLTGETDVKEAAKILAGWGAKEIILSHPGGLLIYADGEFTNTPFTPRNVRGRTGRGDTCICSYLARRLTHSPADSGKFAAVLVSLKMEKEGPFSGSMESVLERMKELGY
ncbi:MAG: PfkB family carbohydrate kinase [bacterium]